MTTSVATALPAHPCLHMWQATHRARCLWSCHPPHTPTHPSPCWCPPCPSHCPYPCPCLQHGSRPLQRTQRPACTALTAALAAQATELGVPQQLQQPSSHNSHSNHRSQSNHNRRGHACCPYISLSLRASTTPCQDSGSTRAGDSGRAGRICQVKQNWERTWVRVCCMGEAFSQVGLTAQLALLCQHEEHTYDVRNRVS